MSILLIHPLIASIAVLLFFANAYLGVSRYMVVVKRSENRFFRFNRPLHLKFGKTFLLLLYTAFPVGLYGVMVAEDVPFKSPHAFIGLFLLILLGTGGIVGAKTDKGNLSLATIHGRIMLLGAAVIFLQVLGGINNLRTLGLI